MKDFNLSDYLNGDSKSISSLLDLNEDRNIGQHYEMVERKVVKHGEGSKYIESLRYEILKDMVSYLKIPYRSQMTRKSEFAEAIFGYIVKKFDLTTKKKKKQK